MNRFNNGMIRVISVILALMMIFFLVGCVGDPVPTDGTGSTDPSDHTNATTVATDPSSPSVGNGEYTLKYIQVLGGTVPLRSSELPTAETEKESGFHYVADIKRPYTDEGYTDKVGSGVGYPQIANSGYASDDIPLFNYNVMDYDAKADGVTDDTKAIQKALSKAAAMGGGTVYIPAGTYRVDGILSIAETVTLRGDFRGPDDENAPGNGTVLLAYTGREKPNERAFITLASGACLMNVTVYYPEQTPDQIVEYAPTVAYDAKGATYAMVKNCWFVNSYEMIDFGNTDANGCHYIQNVYGTPLKQGITIDTCYDVGRMEGIFLSPQYWLKAQELGISEHYDDARNNAMFQYVAENAVGTSLYYSDWEYIYNYNVDSLHTAVNFPDNPNRRANIQMSHSTIYNCTVGISCEEISPVGSMVSNTTIIAAETEGATCVLSPARNEEYPVQFNNCYLESKGGPAVTQIGRGMLQFVNCTFKTGKADCYAVDLQSNGSLYVEQCEFLNESKHVHVGKTATTTQILGCTYAGKEDMLLEREAGYKVTTNAESLKMPSQSGLAHPYKQTEPTPKNMYVYYLLKYGAKSGEDCTVAFKAALADAAKTGGTVYIPAGKYILKESITIPSGVELRGCATGAFAAFNHTNGKAMGTVILAEPPQNADGEALIKLEANSGVSGLSILYTQQKITATTAIAYPYTIQGLGEGVWVKNVCLVNSYKGIDFNTYPCKNHYIWQVTGAPLEVGIHVGNSSGNGWIEFAHFNPGYWRNMTEYYKGAATADTDVLNYQLDNLDAYIFEDCYSEHLLGTFVYGANRGIVINSNKFNGIILGHGTDNADRAIVVTDCDKVEFVNSTLTVIDHSKDILFVDVEASNTGNAEFYNLLMFGQDTNAKCSMKLSGGRIGMQQGYFYQASGELLCLIDGGNVHVSGMIMKTTPKHFQVENSVEAVVLAGNFVKPNNLDIQPDDDVLTVINNAGSKLELINNRYR